MSVHEFLYEVVLKPKPLRMATNAALRAISPTQKRLGEAWWTPNPNDPVVSGGAAIGLYEKAGTAFFTRVCKPGMTFLDIGANTGYFSAWAISLMRGTGRIIAFEPDPEARGYLESTREANNCGFMTIIPAAASDGEGVAQLYKNGNNRGANRLWENNLCSSAVTVKCEPIDSVLGALNVDSVDLIKIDVEGFECHALRGMTKTIARSPNVTLLMEFWPWGLAQAGSSANEVLRTLETLGFSLFELTRGGLLRPLCEHQTFIDSHSGRTQSNIAGFRKVPSLASSLNRAEADIEAIRGIAML